jgi:hypothetical protein
MIDGILKTLGLIAIGAIGYALGKRHYEQGQGQLLLPRMPEWCLPDEDVMVDNGEHRQSQHQRKPRRVN